VRVAKTPILCGLLSVFYATCNRLAVVVRHVLIRVLELCADRHDGSCIALNRFMSLGVREGKVVTTGFESSTVRLSTFAKGSSGRV
jgi:hypothetical protein